jgi:hypothetical protein
MRKMSKRPGKSKKSKKGHNRKPLAVSGRKPSKEESLNAAVRNAREKWRGYEELLKA